MYHSQCGEDKTLNNKYFKNKKNGNFIELGALDGKLYSNTLFFEKELLWSGILIEPHINMYTELKNNRPKAYLFNELISDNNEEVIFKSFKDNKYGACVSGVKNTLPENHYSGFYDNPGWTNFKQHEEKIKPVSLTEVIKRTPITHFDLLSLDVEGHELEVLKSWDFSIPIDVILIEKNPRSEDCNKLLVKHGYKFDGVCAHNDIYIINNIKKGNTGLIVKLKNNASK